MTSSVMAFLTRTSMRPLAGRFHPENLNAAVLAVSNIDFSLTIQRDSRGQEELSRSATGAAEGKSKLTFRTERRDVIVSSLHHQHITVRVNCDPFRLVEVAGCIAEAPECGEEFSRGVQVLDAEVERIDHPETAIRGKSDVRWIVEFSRAVTGLAKAVQHLAVSGQHDNSHGHRIHHIEDIAFGIDSQSGAAFENAFVSGDRSQRLQVFSIGAKYKDSRASGVSHIDPALAIERDGNRR